MNGPTLINVLVAFAVVIAIVFVLGMCGFR